MYVDSCSALYEAKWHLFDNLLQYMNTSTQGKANATFQTNINQEKPAKLTRRGTHNIIMQ
jgi:hypothetical protein